MKITVIGTGYVGLVSGSGFAEFGNQVVCVDIDHKRIEDLQKGIIPIYEPGLEALVQRNSSRGRLQFSTDLGEAMKASEVIVIAVGTPQSEDGSCDTSYVMAAADEIGQHLEQWAVIVTKSTVPVGTSIKVREAVARHAKVSFAVASNPEFLKEGDAINDFMKPSRVILGVEDERAATVLRNLYSGFVRTRDRIQLMDPASAELTKYAANAMLATRISFMNELSLLAESIGADIEKVRAGIGSDPRIGASFLYAGPGFGGSCFPKDIRSLAHIAKQNNLTLSVVEASERANETQKKVLFQRLRTHFAGDLKGKHIAVWGLSFKPQTDDIRESPALVLIQLLVEAGAKVSASDPEAIPNTRGQLGDIIEYFENPYDAVQNADALVLVTEWKSYRRPMFSTIAERMRGNAVFDGRNIWNEAETNSLGLHYYAIGRGHFPRESPIRR